MNNHQRLSTAAFYTFLGTILLLPLFVLPYLGIPLEYGKATIFFIGTLLALFLWTVSRLKEGTLTIPKSLILLLGGGVALVFALSGAFSGAAKESLLGFGSETITAAAFVMFFITLFLSSVFFQDLKRVLYLYFGLLWVGGIVVLFQLARFFFPDALSLGIFSSTVGNLVGKWNDMALFFGFMVVLTMMMMQFLSVGRKHKTILSILLAVALFFVALANFSLAWVLVGVFALIIFVYALSFGRKGEGEAYNIPILPLIVGVITVIFLLPGNPGGAIGDLFNTSQVEVRPSWQSTLSVGYETIKQDPILGVGPNRFTNNWLLFKPNEVNQTIFWNVDFLQGIGTVPSLLAMLGIVGSIVVLAFLGLFVYRGVRAVFWHRAEEHLSQMMLFSAFMLALYLWIVAIMYVPNTVLLTLTFVFTGLCIALFVRIGVGRNINLAFLKDPRVGFASVLALIILLIVSIVGEYLFVQRSVSVGLFNNGLRILNVEGDVARAERFITRAAGFYEHDRYYRALTELRVLRLQQILNQQNVGQDALRAQFQAGLGNAIDSARLATVYDGSDYANWVTLGRVYEAVIPLGIEGAYENMNSAYERAQSLNPNNPSMLVTRARGEITNENIEEARNYLNQALAMKGDYAEALFLLSQIEAQTGNIEEAIVQAERAALVAPNDVGVFFQLGLLRYNQQNYEGAISALERAVTLNPVFANAKYFLGISYARAGRTEDGIAQFEDIVELNPDSEEALRILNNLRSGRDPLASVQPPPEERDELPLEEEDSGQETL